MDSFITVASQKWATACHFTGALVLSLFMAAMLLMILNPHTFMQLISPRRERGNRHFGKIDRQTRAEMLKWVELHGLDPSCFKTLCNNPGALALPHIPGRKCDICNVVEQSTPGAHVPVPSSSTLPMPVPAATSTATAAAAAENDKSSMTGSVAQPVREFDFVAKSAFFSSPRDLFCEMAAVRIPLPLALKFGSFFKLRNLPHGQKQGDWIREIYRQDAMYRQRITSKRAERDERMQQMLKKNRRPGSIEWADQQTDSSSGSGSSESSDSPDSQPPTALASSSSSTTQGTTSTVASSIPTSNTSTTSKSVSTSTAPSTCSCTPSDPITAVIARQKLEAIEFYKCQHQCECRECGKIDHRYWQPPAGMTQHWFVDHDEGIKRAAKGDYRLESSLVWAFKRAYHNHPGGFDSTDSLLRIAYFERERLVGKPTLTHHTLYNPFRPEDWVQEENFVGGVKVTQAEALVAKLEESKILRANAVASAAALGIKLERWADLEFRRQVPIGIREKIQRKGRNAPHYYAMGINEVLGFHAVEVPAKLGLTPEELAAKDARETEEHRAKMSRLWRSLEKI